MKKTQMLSKPKGSSVPKSNCPLSNALNTNPDFATIKCKKIGNYILSKTIGKGTFSKVKLGYNIPTQQKVAIKILDKSKIKDDKDIQRITREIQILKTLRHNNIAQLYETLSSDKHIYIIMEYIDGGDLFEYIFAKSRLDEAKTAILFQQLISAIEYIHKLGIVHRDIKPENILLNLAHTEIKLVDFGLSNQYEKGSLLSTACGSPCYASPEMILGKHYDGLSSDLWSCGVVLYCMLVGKLPFDDEDIKILYKKIITGNYLIPKFLSPQCINFLNRLLEINPNKRITIPEIRKHSFISDYPLKDLDPEVLIEYDDLEVDYDLVKEIKDLFYPSNNHITQDTIIDFIKKNNHNNLTTMYYLALKQRKRQIKAKLSQKKVERKKCDSFNINNIKKINFETKKSKGTYVLPSNKTDPKKMNFVVINNFVSDNNQKKNVNLNMNMAINKGTINLNKGTNNNNNIHLIISRNQHEENSRLDTTIQHFSSNSNTNANVNNINIIGNNNLTLSNTNYLCKSIGRKDKSYSTVQKPPPLCQLTHNNNNNISYNLSKSKDKQKPISRSLNKKSLNDNSINNTSNHIKNNFSVYSNESNSKQRKKPTNRTVEIAKLENDFKEILSKCRNKSQKQEEHTQLSSYSRKNVVSNNSSVDKRLLMKKIFNEEHQPGNISVTMNSKRILHPHPAHKPQKGKSVLTTTKTRMNPHSINKNANWILNTSLTYERSVSKKNKSNNNTDDFDTLSSYQKIIKNWEECKKKSGIIKSKPQPLNTELNSFNDHSISFISNQTFYK